MRCDLIAFDVNETLLDVTALELAFREAVGDEVSLGEWFARMLHRSLLANELGRYQPFGELGAEALVWLAARRGVELAAADATNLVAGMAALPPHPDVAHGLEEVASLGVPMIALTNGSGQMAERQVDGAGLSHLLTDVFSVESVRRFKPAPEVYQRAAATHEVDISRMVVVAAHDWDVAGAQRAGAVGCFVRRQPWGLSPFTPNMVIDDIGGLRAALEA